LADLLREKKVDFTAFEPAFDAKEYTPDILPDISTQSLMALTGAPEGRVAKLIKFAVKWNKRLEGKKLKLGAEA
jgi:hypothetical protein